MLTQVENADCLLGKAFPYKGRGLLLPTGSAEFQPVFNHPLFSVASSQCPRTSLRGRTTCRD